MNYIKMCPRAQRGKRPPSLIYHIYKRTHKTITNVDLSIWLMYDEIIYGSQQSNCEDDSPDGH